MKKTVLDGGDCVPVMEGRVRLLLTTRFFLGSDGVLADVACGGP